MKLVTIVALALLATGTTRAEPPSKPRIFCAELRRVVHVAELGGDFSYLERSRAAPPKLGFINCEAAGEKKQYWSCGQSLAPDELNRDNLAAQVAECLPEAVREADGLLRDSEFTLPYARIHIGELGGPGAHDGRIVLLVVEAVRPSPQPLPVTIK